MKNVVVFTILGIFFIIVFFYILKDFAPFDLAKVDELIKSNALLPGEWDKLNVLLKEAVERGLIFQYLSNVAYFAFGILAAIIFCFLTAIHLFIDKLFFRSYYEKPSLYNAARRAFLIVGSLALMFYMRLSLLEPQIILLVPICAVIIEIIISTVINPFVKGKMTNLKKEKTKESKEVQKSETTLVEKEPKNDGTDS